MCRSESWRLNTTCDAHWPPLIIGIAVFFPLRLETRAKQDPILQPSLTG